MNEIAVTTTAQMLSSFSILNKDKTEAIEALKSIFGKQTPVNESNKQQPQTQQQQESQQPLQQSQPQPQPQQQQPQQQPKQPKQQQRSQKQKRTNRLIELDDDEDKSPTNGLFLNGPDVQHKAVADSTNAKETTPKTTVTSGWKSAKPSFY